jgi:coenzyme F420-reducing hydrogenase alpha subunit
MTERPRTKTRTIKADYLARVEGEGALYVKVVRGQVRDVKLRIFEPPRFFEAFLRGRDHSEVVDIVARICGICPIAYQMSAAHAIEQAFGVTIDPRVRELRRLMYCGEWIESHGLHIFMLHAPDFLGYPDGIAMAQDQPVKVQAGLEVKKIGNELVALLGGREIHPVSVRVGGFHRAPRKRELRPFREKLLRGRDLSIDALRWVRNFEFPDFEQHYEFVAVDHPEEYPFNEGRLVSNRGLDIDIADFSQHFEERHVQHSNALHCVRKGGGSYLTGPLARWNLSYDRLPDSVKELARETGVEPPVRNPFRSIVVRALEMLFAFEEALRVVETYEPPDEPYAEFEPRAGIGHGCTEAPRGLLYHCYELDDEGRIVSARIVPPTSQNQGRIEDDLRSFAVRIADLPEAEMAWQCEQAVRNYDPCISCATHFLKLTLERE